MKSYQESHSDAWLPGKQCCQNHGGIRPSVDQNPRCHQAYSGLKAILEKWRHLNILFTWKLNLVVAGGVFHLHSWLFDHRRPCMVGREGQAGSYTFGILFHHGGRCPHTPYLDPKDPKEGLCLLLGTLFQSMNVFCCLYSPDTTGMGHLVVHGVLHLSLWAWMAVSSFWIFCLILFRTPCSHDTSEIFGWFPLVCHCWTETRLRGWNLVSVHLKHPDVGRENCVHDFLDVGMVLLHLIGKLTHHHVVVWKH